MEDRLIMTNNDGANVTELIITPRKIGIGYSVQWSGNGISGRGIQANSPLEGVNKVLDDILTEARKCPRGRPSWRMRKVRELAGCRNLQIVIHIDTAIEGAASAA